MVIVVGKTHAAAGAHIVDCTDSVYRVGVCTDKRITV